MKVLHINTFDSGGAATACMRIHKALLEQGIESRVLVLNKTKKTPGVYAFDENHGGRWTRYYRLIRRFIREKLLGRRHARLPANPVYFSYPDSLYDVTEHPLYKEADVIQLNWVSGFLDEPSFFRKNKKPVIWRMADLYACGGGNHYEKGFPFSGWKKLVDRNIRIRRKALAHASLFMVPISNWTMTKARESSVIGRFPMRVIHNGVDLNVFRQHDRDFARNFWGFPSNKKIILFGADHVDEARKGLSLLLEALKLVDGNDIHLCTFGGGELGEGIQSLGRIDDERLLSLLYAAVDLFVMSSLEETFGQVNIECIACGIPVVSFPNGGGLDVIRSGINGVLADDFTSQALAEALNKALKTNFDRNAVRADAVARFDIKEKAREYIGLYGDLLKGEKLDS